MKKQLFILAFGVAASALVNARTPEGNYAVQKRWELGGEGGWNGLTADALYHRLYVTRTNRVMVVDTETGKATGEISGFGNVRTVCLDANGKYGYITDNARNVVEVFDRATLRLVAWVPTGTAPDAAVFDAASHSVFVLNRRARSVTVIDAASNAAVGSIEIPGTPARAASDGKGSVFVSIEDKSQIVRIDTRTRTLAATWPVAGCVGPNGLALDGEQQHLYAVCENSRISMLDSATGGIVASAELGDGARDLVFDARRKLVLAVNAGGTLTVIRVNEQSKSGQEQFTMLQKVETQAGARMLALDQISERVYLATAKFGLRTNETSEELLFRPTPAPGSFVVLVVGE